MTETLPQLAAELDALLHNAALFRLDHLGWLRVTGEDRVRWLNGMVTNSINDLAPGQGNYNFLLNAQGRIQGTATAYALPDSILLETDRTQIDPILALLDRFIIMDDVELSPIERTGIGIAGPEAAALLAHIGLAVSEHPLSLTQTVWHGAPIDLIHAHGPLVPRFELWMESETAPDLYRTLSNAGGKSPSDEALEVLRLLEGTPRYGTDIRDRDLPQETAQTHALQFSKGCYLGQEIVERIRSRGQVHRTLHGFRLQGAFPPLNTPLESNGKPVGELTSAAVIPLASGTIQLALGTIRREALATLITYPGGTAYPIPLPYTSI